MRHARSLSLAALALALFITGIGPNGDDASAARGEVICKFVKVNGKKRVSCPKRGLRGKKGAAGAPGAAGATGPAGPAGPAGAGAGSGLTLNFNAKLNAAQVRQVVIGNFTIRAAAQPSGVCENIKLLTESLKSRVSIGAGQAFGILESNSAVDVQGGDTSNLFTAVTENGASTVSGIVGRTTVGGFCLVSGYVTGI
jgi:hypothetical protein